MYSELFTRILNNLNLVQRITLSVFVKNDHRIVRSIIHKCILVYTHFIYKLRSILYEYWLEEDVIIIERTDLHPKNVQYYCRFVPGEFRALNVKDKFKNHNIKLY